MRLIRYAALASILLLHVLPAAANIRLVEYDLPNGLHVILHEDHSAPLVAVSVMYHVGSKNEVAGHTGFADLTERILYNGGDNKPGEYNELVQAAGGQSGGNLTQDRTVFYDLLPSAQMGLGIWVEAHRMSYAHMDKAFIEEQRKIMKQDKYKYYSMPYALRYNLVYENSYITSPYRWNTLAKDQYADKAAAEEEADFYHNYYVPNNAVIVITGDINEQYARDYISKYFGNIPAGSKSIVHPTIPEPEHTVEKRIAYYDNVQAPAIILAYHIPAMGTPDYYGVQLLMRVLTSGKNGLFNKNVVAQGRAQNVSAIALSNEQPGLAIILGVSNPNVKPDGLEHSLLAEIENLNTQITEADYQRALNSAEADFVQDNQRPQLLAQNLATGYTYLHNSYAINEELANYEKTTLKDLQRIAAKYFTKQNRLVVYYLPKSMQKK